MKYRVFISYSRKDETQVTELHRILEASFPNIEFWRDRQGLNDGDEISGTIKEAISSSHLVLLWLTASSAESAYVRKEIAWTKQHQVPLLPINIDDTRQKLNLDETRPDLSDILMVEAPGNLVGMEALGRILAKVRANYESHFKDEVMIFDSAEAMLQDVTQNPISELSAFMIDGGTTLRRLLVRQRVEEMLSRSASGVDVRFLFYDCENLEALQKTECWKMRGAGSTLTEEDVSLVLESTLQASSWIHNYGPHSRDVADNVASVEEISKELPDFRAEVRISPRLPVNRLICTDRHTYVPSFFPLAGGDRPIPEYYALRFGSRYHVSRIAKEYFDRCWDQARVLFAPNS